MKKISLGSTKLRVTPVCYGTWQISNEWNFRIEEKQVMVEAMRRAVELGINFFDTADAYGNGLSEKITGEALGVFRRGDFVLATKVFHHFYDDGRRHPDLSKDYIISECEASLKRLGMDYIDLYQCHAFDPLADLEETAAAMDKLKSDGKIKAFGVSNYSPWQLQATREYGDYTSCQPFYSLVHRDGEKNILPYCKSKNIGVLCYTSLHRGLLTGKYKGDEAFSDNRKNHPDFSGERFKSLCEKVQQLKPLADKYSITTVQLVLAATIMNPMIDCAIAGIKNPGHIEEAAGEADKAIDREDYFKVREILSPEQDWSQSCLTLK